MDGSKDELTSPRHWLAWLPRLWANRVTLLGSAIATVAGVAIGLFLIIDLIAPGRNAYGGALLIVALPLLLVLGLLLIPVGLWIERRRRPTLSPSPIEAAFATALHDRGARNRIVFLALITLVNVGLVAFAGQKSIHYMDSPGFCGGACHSVMQPQWDAYRHSPHANVDCVACHIGSSSYVKAKLNGVGQMWKLATRSFHTPITMPVDKLLSSQQTCERCHSQRYVGNRLKVYTHFGTDKDNSPLVDAFMLHVGGPNPRTGKYDGMHWHANPDVEVRYQFLDDARARIGKIDVYERHRLVASFLPPGKHESAVGERTMDCVDCHNRPAHQLDASPKDAIERALDAKLLSAKLPFIAKVGASLLARCDAPRDEAEAFFRRELGESYRREHPEVRLAGLELDASAKALTELYRLNVYPALKLGFGSHRNDLGHGGSQGVGGCFRCHDTQHEAKLADGTTKTLGQDCDSCHERIAMGENPAKLDDTLQLALPKGE
jgi:nitrate/TMAO reductase-like tetraheme cytochrome c subunit